MGLSLFRGLRVSFELDRNDSELGAIGRLECIHHGNPKTSNTIEAPQIKAGFNVRKRSVRETAAYLKICVTVLTFVQVTMGTEPVQRID